MATTMARACTQAHARRRETEWQRFCRIMKKRFRKFLQRNVAKILFFTPLVFGLFAGMFIGMKAATYAHSVKINDYGREMVYTTYIVRSGDTIWGIAEDLAALNPEFNDIRQYVAEIMKANDMADGGIEPGDRILIPYYTNADGMADYSEIYSRYGIGDQK